MKVFEINSVPYGSTCNIMIGIAKIAKKRGHDVITSSGYSTHPIKDLPKNHYNIGNIFDKYLHTILSKITGYNGCFSYITTLCLLQKIKKEKIDLLHLHNIHGWYINIPMLFKFIKKNNIPVIWTLHDCWSFTGKCPHFTMVNCDKWKYGCYDCPQCNQYPESYVDQSKQMWKLKRKWFTGVKNMTIVTPSQWLADLVNNSYLSEYNVKVINNGINLSIFKPTKSNFRTKYNIKNKFIILGVSFGWDKRKGLDVFIELAKRLDNKFQIVLVGTNSEVDKQLPNNIISIHRTQNQKELAEIYTSADVFVNPTREENYPTVNMEALACGTPVITFNTGGSSEIIDNTCGISVAYNDIDKMENEIKSFYKEKKFSRENCIKKAVNFNVYNRLDEYVDLYLEKKKNLINNKDNVA